VSVANTTGEQDSTEPAADVYERLASRTPPKLPAPDAILGGRYRVLRPLGSGGMAHVLLAEHTELGRRVALKILDPMLAVRGPALARRFVREARAASNIQHPNIVDIVDFGATDEGLPFFAMEYLEGEDLGELIEREGAQDWPATREIALQLCSALTAVHEHGLVHRDLKPANVFVTERSSAGGPVLKLLDFGIAKSLDEGETQSLTATGSILGTPQYMSPEQALERNVDVRSDVYSLGVLLFELLAGAPPFHDVGAMALAAHHITVAAPSLRERAPAPDAIPPAIIDLVAQMLAKSPDDRPRSIEAVADELRGARSVLVAPKPSRTGLHLGLGVILAGVAVIAVMSPGPTDALPAAKELVEAKTPAAVVRPEPEGAPVQPAVPPAPAEPSPPPKQAPKAKAAVVPAPHRSTPGEKKTARPPPDRAIRARFERAAKKCSDFVPADGQQIGIEATINAAGEVAKATANPPYSFSPLGRCLSRELGGLSLGPELGARTFKGKVEVHS